MNTFLKISSETIKGNKSTMSEIEELAIMQGLDQIYLTQMYEVFNPTRKQMNHECIRIDPNLVSDKLCHSSKKSDLPPLLDNEFHMQHDLNFRCRNLQYQRDRTQGCINNSFMELMQPSSIRSCFVSESNGVCSNQLSPEYLFKSPKIQSLSSKQNQSLQRRPNNQGNSIQQPNSKDSGHLFLQNIRGKKTCNNRKKNEIENKRKSQENKVNETTPKTEKLLPLTSPNCSGSEKKVEDEFHKVVCMYRKSPNQYWVLNVSDIPTYEKIQKNLSQVSNLEVITNPQINLICGCEYEGALYRARVLSVTPTLRVHFIDFGNFHSYNHDTCCRKLSKDLMELPGLVYLIEFQEGTPVWYNKADLDSHFLIVKKMRQIHNNLYAVKIIKGPFDETQNNESLMSQKQLSLPLDSSEQTQQEILKEEKKNSVNHKSKSQNDFCFSSDKTEETVDPVPAKSKLVKIRYEVNEFTETSKGTIFFLPGSQKIRFGIVVLQKHGEPYSHFKKILSFNSSNLSVTEAEVGDLILVHHKDNNDHISLVLNKCNSTYVVRLMDCDEIVEVDRVYPLLKEHNFVCWNYMVLFTPNECMVKSESFSSKSVFEVVNLAKELKWPCRLSNTENGNIITCGTVEKAPETIFGDFVPVFLSSNCTVKITALGSSNSLYVQKLSAQLIRKQEILNKNLAAHWSSAQNWTSFSETGYICCVKLDEDNGFYRAQVINADEEKAKILLVDIGLTQDTELRNLKCLSSDLQMIPFFSTEVNLAHVSQKPFEQGIKDYFQKLIKEKTELTLSYETYLESVVLKEKATGLIVNNHIETLRCTSIGEEECAVSKLELPNEITLNKTELEENVCFYDHDLRYLEITCGKTYDLLLLHVNQIEYEDKATFWAADLNHPNLVYLNSTLAEEIQTFCRSSCEPYKPTTNEVCLAQFEGVWYRGLALDVSLKDDCFLILFIDFGNTSLLSSDFIRRTKAKFIEPLVLAKAFYIVNHEKILSNPVLKKKVFDFLKNKTNENLSNVKVCKTEEGMMGVEISEIESIIANEV